MRIAQIAPLTEAVPPETLRRHRARRLLLTEELVALGHDVTLFASGDSVTAATLEADVAAGRCGSTDRARLRSRCTC